MAVIYLRHPEHGHKVACSDIEAEHDEGNGWVRFDPTDPSVAHQEAQSEALPRRRGRPPREA